MARFCIFTKCLLFILSSEFLTSANADNQIETVSGGSAKLLCNASTDLRWLLDKAYICDDVTSYKERFQCERISTTNEYNLLILNVSQEDAGNYNCRFIQEGMQKDVYTSLTVLGSKLSCNVKKNLNDLKLPVSLDFSCSVTFYGDVAPKLILKNSKENLPFDVSSDCKPEGNKINCSFHLNNIDAYNNTKFTCETTKDVEKQYNCSTEDVIIPNVHDVLREEIKNNKNCQQNLMYSNKTLINVTQNCTDLKEELDQAQKDRDSYMRAMIAFIILFMVALGLLVVVLIKCTKLKTKSVAKPSADTGVKQEKESVLLTHKHEPGVAHKL